MNDEKEMTALSTSVGADDGQSLNAISDNSITNEDADFNSFEEIQRKMMRMLDPRYLHTVSMTELYDTIYQSRPPLIDGLLYPGTYLFVGAPKLGKSFLMAQLAYHISTGTPLWNYPVRKGTVLYLALEDDYSRLQKRLYQMFGTESTENLYFSVSASQLGSGLDEQLQNFVREHPDSIELFGNGCFQRIGVDRRSVKIVKLRRYFPLLLLRYDYITNAEVDTERRFRVFDFCDEGSADSGVFLCYCNGSHVLDLKCDEIVVGFGCYDFFQYNFELFRRVWYLSEKKIHVNGNAAVKISKGVDEQSAFQDEVFRIFGFFQSAQEFLLAEELQAELIASAAFGSFIFEPCEHGCSNISHSAAPPLHSSFFYKRPFPLHILKGWQGFSSRPPHKR